jgi:hypothetical protein
MRSARAISPVVVGDEELAAVRAGALRSDRVGPGACNSVNDLPGALALARRALKPDGLMLAALIGGQTLTETRAAFAQAEEEIAGGASPRVAPFADVRDLGALLQRAGFALAGDGHGCGDGALSRSVPAVRRSARDGRDQCADAAQPQAAVARRC